MIARGRLAAALLCGLLLASCGEAGQDSSSPAAPASDPVPAALVGTWMADGAAVQAAVLRFLRERTPPEETSPAERAEAEAALERRAAEFAAGWSMELVLHADWTFVYKLRQPRSPTYLRAGRFRAEDTLLHLQVEETRGQDGRVVEDFWKAEWRKHQVRWEGERLRFRAPGRETFEFVLYRP